MKLAEFLADYIRRERKAEGHVCNCQSCWETVIKSGIKAFVKQELAVIDITFAGSTTVMETYE